MKSIFLSLLAVSVCFISCKNETKSDEPVEAATEVVEETPTEVVEEPAIDYTALGMAADDIPEGLAVGSNLAALTYTNADGKTIDFAQLYADKPLVVIFYRGYWCPVCNKYLSNFAAESDKITDAGANIVAIAPETYDNVDKTAANTGIDFTVISDADGSLMRAFDVDFNVTEDYDQMINEKLNASIADTNGADAAELPVPATYIIDTDGTIMYKHFNPDYTQRASIDDIVSALNQ
ncbi:MAG: peroxiredoxin-like family protein [Flavobacteriaceae bacterium]|nr:peroxiredoxin-like family protein [Flavobacteriaceae bacterium]